MKRTCLRVAGFLLLGLHLLGAPGCIPVCPYYASDNFWNWPHGDPMRQNVEKEMDKGFPKVGVLRREEVLARLGEPDHVSEDQTEFVYRWRKVTWLLVGCGSGSHMKSDYFLRIQFDREGIARVIEVP